MAEWQRAITDTAMRRLQKRQQYYASGEIALAERKGRVAMEEFRRADTDDDGYPSHDCAPCSLFDLGRAFDIAELPDSAIVHYERYIATPWRDRVFELDDAVLAGTHKRLGELYEAKGDRQNAIAHYSSFVDLWKNADALFQPRVAEVRQRLVRLNASGR